MINKKALSLNFYLRIVINPKNKALQMLTNYESLILPSCTTLISQIDIVTVLIIVVVIFSFLLILGVRKSFLLKKESDRLSSMNTTIENKNKKPYKDFTDGHMYSK